MSHTVLIVDDEIKFAEVLSVAVSEFGYKVKTASDGEQALKLFEAEPVDVVITDLRMPGMGGSDLLKEIRRRAPDIPVIILTAYSSLKDAVSLAKEGAFDYLAKPVEIDELEATLRNATRLYDAIRNNERLRDELAGRYKFSNLIGKSIAFKRTLVAISELSGSSANVLITGESGTGKEMVARAIHFSSPKKDGPFVAVNCAAIPEGLLESELFGHKKGAFTGAISNRVGRFMQANQGTLFLDEIGDMGLSLQAKILRAIQERVFEPVGSTESQLADIRIIAATNKNLRSAVSDGKFRDDLFYRLNVFPIALPALRERPDDIPDLANHFLSIVAGATGKRIESISDEALDAMCKFSWPGNVRELENCVERAVIVAKGRSIEVRDLPEYLFESPVSGKMRATRFPVDLDVEIAALERAFIVDALSQTGGVQVAAAELLGINERSLWHRIKKFKIKLSTQPR
ncbi:MAG: sigma-54-dependent transcriptional regulator [Parvibaculaceae bacterium]